MLTALNSHKCDRHDRPTRVILLRHGQSTYNSLGLYQGSSDRSNLTELGRYQARLAGEFLQGIAFDAIYASPLQRAKETASEVLQAIDSHDSKVTYTINPNHIRIVARLRETDLPNWQGLPFQFVKAQFPEAYRCWKHTPDRFWMEIAETEKTGEDSPSRNQAANPKQKFFPALDLYDRVQQFWQEILPSHIGQTILIVSHGGTNRALISTALGITPDRYHAIEQSNCALSILNFPNGRLESGQLELMNFASHVSETLPQVQSGETGQRLLLIPAETCDRNQILNLAHLLKPETIDFCLSTDLTHQISEQILQYHPKALKLEALREDFLLLWQQSLDVKNQAPSDRLNTGIVIAHRRAIAHSIEQILGIDPTAQTTEATSAISIHPGTVSAIHYPGSAHPPLLQAMNIVLSCELINRFKFTRSELASFAIAS